MGGRAVLTPVGGDEGVQAGILSLRHMGCQYASVATVVLAEARCVTSRPMLALWEPGIVESRPNRPTEWSRRRWPRGRPVRPIGRKQYRQQRCEEQHPRDGQISDSPMRWGTPGMYLSIATHLRPF